MAGGVSVPKNRSLSNGDMHKQEVSLEKKSLERKGDPEISPLQEADSGS
jgi:hypothetical protein